MEWSGVEWMRVHLALILVVASVPTVGWWLARNTCGADDGQGMSSSALPGAVQLASMQV